MSIQLINQFNVIGISVRTTNENDMAAKDIPALWQKFMQERIIDKIPNKIDDTVYCIYTEYEKDHTKPYTAILGCSVKDLNHIPDGMVCKIINTTSYETFTAKGNLMQGAVFNEWVKIWNSDLNRAFTADFELYNQKSMNPEDAEVDIMIALK